MDAREVELIYELSPMQQAMLFHSLYAPGTGVYVIQQSLRLTGRLDVPALERAWRSLVDRHGILRTAFFWEDLEKPLQVVHRQAPFAIARESWRGLSADEQREKLARALAADLERGFDLAEPPLFRLALFELDEDVHQLVWSYHHLLSDGWSQGLLLRELFTAYAAYAQGREPALPKPRPFRDYIAWLQRQDLGRAEAFWRQSLAGFSSPTLVLEPDGRPEGPRPEDSRRAVLPLSTESSTALREAARRHRLTLNTLVQGAWALLLSRMTGSGDVVFGTTVSGRPADLPGVESIIGLFINTLPARTEVRPEQRLQEWLSILQQRQVEIRRFEHSPLVEVQRWSELPAGTPLFDHILVFENLALPGEVSGGLQGLTIQEEAATTSTNYPLNVVVIPGARLTLTALYDAARFHGAEVTRLLQRLTGVLAVFATDQDPLLGEIPVLLEAERQQVLVEWNDTRSAYPGQASLPELFAEVAREHPEAPALIDPAGEVWSYRRLDEESNRLARRLLALGARLGVGPESAVGISMERSAELILGTLAILKAGGLYVPLDASYPDDRLAFMLEDTGARLVLVHAATRERLSGLASVLDVDTADWRGEVSASPGVRVPSDSLTYVIYTSGSTGRPKGVAVPHRAIARLVRETNYVRLGPGDRTGQIANISFDAATYEIWGALLTGAAVTVIPREVVLSPADFARAIRERGVTSMFLTSALFTRMSREEPDAFATMSELLVGGEAVDPAAARAVLAGQPPRRLLNGYGPTESTTFATWHLITEAPEGTSVPIGRALANTTLHVLDRTSAPVPPGSPGELCIGGDGLARGYLNRPELTAEKFIPHPWADGERLYRTGDLVRQRWDGAVEYLGRLDHQVKIRGFRIEPGEIEAVLASHPEIRECAVLARRDAGPNPGETRLVAYVVADADPAALRAWLQERLPDYMVPTGWVALDSLPLTANGKLDRRALPSPERTGSADADSAPSDPIEEQLATIWAEVLGLERVGVHDDFFALGGHSLLATQVVSRVRSAFEVDLPLRDLFESPTVADLARAVRAARQDEREPALAAAPAPAAQGAQGTVRRFPLSFAQQRLWLIDQLDPYSPAYNIPLALRLDGAVAPALLARIFAEIVERHEVLRTTFASGPEGPVQVIAPGSGAGGGPELPLLDLGGLPPGSREAAALDLAREEALRPFDLRRGPVLRLALLRLGEREHVLLLTMHHIASDGWSMGVLLREVAALYEAFSRGLPSPLPALRLQYADFAVWQREWLGEEVLRAELGHWTERLAGAPRLLELPTDRPRPPRQTFRGAARTVALPPLLSSQVRELCHRHEVTPFMTLLAAWAVLLGRHAGQPDVLVGTPIAGRNRREIEDLIGFFVNTLVLRVDARGNPGFAGLLGRVRNAALDAFSHQDVPFERLVEELVPERDLAVSPLFQVLFALQNAPVGELALSGLSLAPIPAGVRVAKLDLTLALAEGGEGVFSGSLEHAADLFDATTAARLWVRFEALLQAAVAAPEQGVADLPLLLPAELHQVLVEPNASNGAAPPEATVPALFLEHAAATPDLPAVLLAGEPPEVLSYGELDRRSARWARALRALGVGPEARVGICVRRSPRMIVGLLAVLRAGGAYVPLDPAWPAERLTWMLDDAGVELVLTESATADRIPGETSRPLRLLSLEEEPGDVPELPLEPPLAAQPAYVIYTSGSTGRPKGVVAVQGGLAAFTQALAGVMELTPADRVLQYASLSFDASAVAIWPALIRGAAVVVHPDPLALSTRDLLALSDSQGWSVLELPAALWRQVVQEMDGAGLRFGPGVRLFMTGGESLAPEVLRQWGRTVAPEARLVSSYGPTETTVVATVFRAEGREARSAVLAGAPLGGALEGTAVYLLDHRLAPVPLDVPGELCLGGAGVTRGYLGRPELTAAAFLPDPWGLPGSRLYRTGDRARRRPDGGLEFLGRIDQQVKIRGFRIEPGEIEALLGEHPAVREAVVLARTWGGAADARLAAYVTLRDGAAEVAAGEAELRSWLRERAPEHLVPSAFVVLHAFPLAPTGKVDRRALPAPERRADADGAGFGSGHAEPGDPLEVLLAGIWAELLGLDRVGLHDDFFVLGGHSLLATQVLSRVRNVFGVELPLRSLFATPTVAALARLVREAQGGLAASAMVALPRQAAIPLSFAQQRLWLADQLDPDSPAYNMPLPMRLRGELAPHLLARVFAEIVARHEALRTTFASIGGQPLQVIAPAAGSEPALPLVDLSALPEGAREAAALELAGEEARRPFDLRHGPLLRLTLLRLAGSEHVLLTTMHHIVSDGWSMGVLLREIAALYPAFLHGGPSPLPPLPLQYADFAVWQRGWLQGKVLDAELSHWMQRLAGAPRVLELPTDRPRPVPRTSRGAGVPVALPLSLSEGVREICRREGTTPFMVLLAAWAVLLGRHAGQEDVLVGTPIAGRNRREVEDLIGFFVNTLVLRVNAHGGPGFGELLGRVRAAALDAFTHQDVPFERLVEELVPERDLAVSPLFQVMFALQNASVGELALPGLTLAPIAMSSGAAKFDLSLALGERGGLFAGTLEHDTSLFDASTMERLWARFAALLEAAVADPVRPLAELPLLLADERQQALLEHNDTRRDFPREASLSARFAEVAAASPEAAAVVEVDGTVRSYRWLNEASDRLACHLRRRGVEPGALVGVAMERSADLVVALLGILKAGAAYVPLDAGLPDDRLAFLLEDTGASVALVHGPTRDRFAALPGLSLICLERDREALAAPAAHASPAPVPPVLPAEALAYVIYTSGSTGQPKGVAVSHQAVLRLAAATGFLDLRPDDRLAFNANPAFDAATWEIWAPLLRGATLVVIPRDLLLSPAALAEHVERHEVTVLHLTAALFAQVARQAPQALACPRCVLFGGEASAPAAVSEALREAAPRRLLQMYGPTESTTFATWYQVTEVPPGAATIPIGRPLENTTAYVLDPWGHPAPPRQAGELWLGGEGIAQGYWNRPGLTAERFVPDPWSVEPGGRLYRTGDLARRRPDGDLEFQGRIDHQVKIRGFRIEPGEVEAVLAALPEVAECVVLARRHDARRGGEVHLAAYVVPRGSEVREEGLRAALAERLPDYMVPTAWMFLEALPLTSNGKVDRQALPAPEAAEPAGGEGYAAPADRVEELLAGILGEVLGLDRVGVHDDFFALGGHSLLGARVTSRVRELFGVELPLRRLFEAPTVARLARSLRAMGYEPRPQGAALVAVPRAGDLPLSFAQQRLWLIDQLEPGSAAYNMPFPVRLRGAVSPRLLAWIFAEVVARHEVLRTTFGAVEGRPVQVIAAPHEPSLPVVDLSALPGEAREAVALALAREEARRPFDLARGPLLRLTLLRLAGDEHVLLTTMHHIVSDGWSMGVLLREIAALYPAFLEGLPAPLPALPMQYADFAVWQRGWMQGEVLRRQLDHWRERLDGAPLVLELPTDRPRPPRRSFRGGSLPVVLPAPLAERVRAIGQRHGATPFMVLLAAWGLLLGRHAGQQDVLLGTPIAGRNRREIEDLIGFFVNTLVLRVNAQGSPGFGELLGRVRAAALDAFAHQDLPFERLVEELAAERDLAITPLFQAMFALQNAPVGELVLPGLSLAPVALDGGMAKFDLSLGLGERGDGFAGTLEHDSDLFDAATAERLWGRFEALLEAATGAPDVPAADLPLLLPAERQQLADWNQTGDRTGEESARGLCLHELFAAQAGRTPDAVALVHESGRSTYAELAARAGGLARCLRALGVGPEVRVAVCLERSPDLVASLLGVLAAGGAYVPVDPAYPVERRALMLEDSEATVLVTRGTLAADLPAAGARVLDLDVERIPPADGLPAGSGVEPGHLAYVIYTSGSTGRPKGVAIEHRSAVALAAWAREELSAEELSGVLAATSVCFDLSVFEIFVPLAWGGTIVLADNALALATHPAADRVRLLNTVPSAATELLRIGGLPASVRTVCLAGEPLPGSLAAGLYATGTVRRVLNLYGPSEDTTYSTGAVAPPETGRAPSIGRPLPGTRAWVVDRRGALVPPGVAGELWLAGAGLARGYLGRPELTAERFTPDPFGDEGERVYRTGDLVRHRPRVPAGLELDFLGRIDHQVKIRGFRIELGEIEAALAAQPGVRSCAALAREDVPGVRQLVAYLAGEVEALPDDATLRSALGARLPEHMVPAVFVRLEALPLSPNGKVDRRSLPAPDRARRATAAEYVAPRTPTEEVLAGIWQEVLGVERVGVEDRFFDLGGHSLLATQVLARVREALGVELPLRRLFEHPTVARLAHTIQETIQETVQEAGGKMGGEMGQTRRGGTAAAPLVPVPREGALPLSFAQQRLWLIDQLDPDSTAYNMPCPVRLRGEVDPGLLARIFAEVVARHESLRTTFSSSEGEPAQVIAPAAGSAPELPLVDLSALPEGERETAATRLVLEDTLRPFDLRRGPLLRLSLLRLAARDHVLLMTMHHIVSDGWSMGVLLREIAALYHAFSQGKPSPLPPLPVQYADFAVWQREWLQGEVLRQQLDHWKQRLAGAPRVLELPTDRPRPPVQSLRGASRPVSLPPVLSARVRDLGRAHRTTPFMTLMAAWALLLGRHAGQPDVLVGSPIAGRNRREIEGLIGFFVNTLVLRVDASGDSGGPGFAGLLERVRGAALDAFAHQDVPFERLVEELVPERDLSMSPLFQVMFALQNAPLGELALPGLTLAPVTYENRVAKFDLSLALGERAGTFAGSLDHNADLFDAATPARLWARFEALLEAAAADPGRPVADLPLLLPIELHQVLVEPNAQRDVPPPPSLTEQFLEHAAATPEAPALVLAGSPTGSLTYAELERRSARLARFLRSLGVGPEVRVAVCAGRSPRTLVGLLAVLRAGGAYLPLDPSWPADRMAWMLEDAGAALVLTDRETAGRLPPLGNDPTRGLLFLEDEPADRPEIRLEPPIATQAAYVIYTSGSTGRPKGVVALHGGLAAFSRALAGAMELAPGDRVLQYASLSFDASAVEIWPALIRGAAVAVHPDPTALSARELLALSASEGWTVVNLPAAPWRQMVQDVEEAGRSFPAGVRLFITGGESLSPEALRQWRRVVSPEARLLSCYGPTETTVIVSLYEASAGQPDGAPALGAPLGAMLPGTTLYLLDGRLAPVPLDVPGEVFLGGPWVTRGYLGRPAQTAAVFLPDPWGPAGARLYRTGDRARLRPDGGLEFLGRIDHQVKIRGFRVEPGEIETVLAGHPGVRECAVLARRDAGGGAASGETRLVAYAVLQPDADLNDPPTALRAWLRERLPEALVPSAFVLLDAFPTSTSGKIDRQALPAPERVRGTGEDHVPPGDPLEAALAGVWEELLGVERVGVHDDFFALGGHSLLATRVLSRVRDLCGVELPLRRLFAQPTVAALARLVREAQREGGGRGPAIVPVPREDWPDGLPLSFAQQRLWFLEQLEPGNAAYHMPQAVRLTGRVSADLLERIFGAIVARHEALRTTFVSRGEQPAQVIAPASGVTGASRPVLRVIDLSGLPEAEREETALALAKREATRPFDLRTGPLLRQTLVRLNVEDEAEDHLLLLNVHHIVSDGWSMGVLLGEIAELYRSFSTGDEPRLPALPVQYADYAVWQRGWLQGEVLAAELAWWREQLAGLPPLLELPTDRPRPPVQSFRGGQLGLRLPAGLSDRLRALAHREGATLFMALLAGFQALLARSSGQDQIAVGSPIAGRNHSEIESLIGFFVNTLVLRGDLSASSSDIPGFRELVGRARERALGAYAHQEVPFEKLVEELAPERSLAHAPLFQVMLVLQNTAEQGLALEGLRLRPVDTGSAGAKFDLTLSLQEHGGPILGGQIVGGLTYASDLFDAATLRRFLGRFEHLLAAALADPATPWTELPLLSPAEAGQLLEWTDTAATVPLERLLHERIADRARQAPQAAAVIAPDGRLSFAALDRRANQLARHLIALGVAPESRVALCMDRSLDLVVGLLAALKAGAAFVVVDPAQPLPRLSRVLRDAAPAAVLTREPAGSGLPEVSEDWEAPVVWLDRQAAEIALESAEDPRIPVDPEQAAYVVYTSGSTGTPKGVVIRHGAVLNLLAALERTVYAGAAAGLRVSVNAPLYFDGAIKQVIQLAQGRTLCLVPDEVRADAVALGRYLAEERVDVLDCTPAQLRALLESEAPLPARLLVGGEAVDQALWDRLARLPGTASFNVYGPSECTVDTTARRIAPDAPRPVLGRPLVNVRTHVMSAALLPQPPGIPGELWIGGAGVARGYLGRPDLTAERFVPDPFSLEPGARLYRTGDLVRWLAEGELEFLGRTDHQVKVRGFRIELGEIEAVLAGHPAVRDCAVLVREERLIGEAAGDRRLVAWVALQEGDATGAAAALSSGLSNWLRDRLPAYMVPSSFGLLGELPLTPNGKVDRRALAALAPESPAGENRYVPPADPVEEMLAGIWAEVLGVERVGSRDSFFELGGHSLLATRVTSRVRAQLGVELPLRALFESPTLGDLARAVRAAREAETLAAPPLLPVPPEQRGATFPLSFAQQRLWFLDQVEPGNPAYNIPHPVRVRGELPPERLERIFAEIVARHEALRTTFALQDGAPVQVVHADLRPELRLFDLSDLPEAEREERAGRLVADEARRPFDLAAGPLVRLTLARLGERDQILLLTLHHIVADGWSMGVLLREIAQSMEGPLPPLSLQYADYAVWQRSWLRGDVLREQLDHWKRRLAGAPQVLELPTDRPRPPVQTFRGAASPITLSPALAEGVRALCRREGTTPFMALLAAWAVLLGRHAGQDDLLVGSPIAGRNRRETEELIGLFINTLVLRADLREAAEPLTFRGLLGRVRETALDAFAHQDVPFERLVEELVAERNLAVSPLFQVLFTLQNTPRATFQPAGLTLEPVALESSVAKVDLSLTLGEGAAGIAGSLEHNTDLFDTATAERLAARFAALLEAAAADPGRALGDLPLLLPSEVDQALSVWNPVPPASPPAAASCLHDLISRQALRTPDAVAVADESGGLTYRELDARSNQMAHHLLALGVTVETPVGVRLERSPGLLVALLGILKAGGAYVPLDPSWPAERTAFVLAAAGVSLVLDRLPETGHLPAHPPAFTVDPGQLAYVLFTSGSTGAPKGVMVQHASVVRYLEWSVEAYGLAPGRRSLLHSPLGFDLTVTALFAPLLAGGEVRLVPESAGVETIQELTRALDGGGDVQLLKLTPAHLEILGGELEPAAAARVGTLVVGGDALRGAALGVWRTGAPGTLVVNEYGPTEATVGCCVHAAPAGEIGGGRVPIGHPIDGARLHVVDRHAQLLPPGARGELLIGGDGLARGYLGRPDLTAERFLPDPWATHPGDRLYRTGDLVVRRADGSLDFLGRNDHQVKVRGFRIELGEIEAVLGRHPEVREVVVIVREDVPGDRVLAAYVVFEGEEAGDAGVDGLRSFAAGRLPSYMVPAAIVPLRSLPLTPNGKVDRKALPAPERVRSGPAFVGPRDALELEIARIWEELLNVRPVGVRDDFFALGGHSLLAAQLTARLRGCFGREVPLVALLRAPTVERLAVLLREEAGPEPQGVLVELGAGSGVGSATPLFLVHPVGGEVLSYVHLARHLSSGLAVYGLRMPDDAALPETIEEMAAGYLREIREVQPEGPYTLGGWSLGGVVAFEMARQLEARGESVEAVVLIDSFAPDAAPAQGLSGGPLVAAFAFDLARGLGLEVAGPPADLAGLEADEALRRLAERAEAAGLLPPGLRLADLERRFARFAANLRAVERYAGGESGARLLLARAAERPAGMAPPLADLGWNRLARRPVEVHELPGDHYRLLQEPIAETLAALVREQLANGPSWIGLLPDLPDTKTDEILQMEESR